MVLIEQHGLVDTCAVFGVEDARLVQTNDLGRDGVTLVCFFTVIGGGIK